jgi:hypothetical protein
MTMNTGLARALRRFAGGVAIMLAGLTGMHHRLYATIRVPPAHVDRVVVTSPEGRSHEITDPAAVAGIVRSLRSLPDHALRIPDRICFNPNLRFWRVAFYRGAEDHDAIGLHDQVIFAQRAVIRMSTEEALDLHRLLRAGANPAPSAE